MTYIIKNIIKQINFFHKILISGRNFLRRIIFVYRVIVNYKKEAFFSLSLLIRYLFDNSFYPDIKRINFKKQFETFKSHEYYLLKFENRKFYYSNKYTYERIVRNFSTVLNEQRAGHPHKYSFELIKKNWVVYDFGVAEGYQTHRFLQLSNLVIGFEPDIEFYNCLTQTFQKEIAENKLIIFNQGIGENNSIRLFNNLSDFIQIKNIPFPDYIKADIEGDELNLLKTLSEPIIKNLKMVDITVYHRPLDYEVIPSFLKCFGGNGYFRKGYIILNIDTWNRAGWNHGGKLRVIFSPVIRKVLYTHSF